MHNTCISVETVSETIVNGIWILSVIDKIAIRSYYNFHKSDKRFFPASEWGTVANMKFKYNLFFLNAWVYNLLIEANSWSQLLITAESVKCWNTLTPTHHIQYATCYKNAVTFWIWVSCHAVGNCAGDCASMMNADMANKTFQGTLTKTNA